MKKRETSDQMLEKKRLTEEKIAEYERLGLFDCDIEEDPATRELLPDEIEYIEKTVWQKIKTRFAFFLAYRYADKLERKREYSIKEIIGLENLSVSGGAIITANHFSPQDSFIMNRVFDASKRVGNFYRVIREGNYTSFGGFYGFLMRNCNTLPLSSNRATMMKFTRAVKTLLCRGDTVLVYPEQGMWPGYKKPRPLKIGAFELAVMGKVPVIPIFITFEDSQGRHGEALGVEHTVHVGAPIFPDESLPKLERAEKMKKDNFDFNKNVYESFYRTELTYTNQ